MNVNIQYVASLVAHLSLNCSFCIVCYSFGSFVLCYASIDLNCYYPLDLCFTALYLWLSIILFSGQYCFSLLLILPFVYKCKDHCHRVETQTQLINIT
jgi:hypothetical protein